jgi:hypothetical protein
LLVLETEQNATPTRGFRLVQVRKNVDAELANMDGSILTSLYVFAVVFLSLGALFVVVKLLTGGRRGDASHEAPEHDPRLMEEWFEQPAHRQIPPMPPMFPQSDAEHFRAAHEALEQNLPVPLPPARSDERETW